MKKLKILGWLFGVNLFISTFTFGGGYVVVPMVRRFFVNKKHYFTEDELMNMAAVSQSTPGAIAVNLSALAGYRTAGIWGLLLSCIAALLPPIIILSIISSCYHQLISNTAAVSVLKGMEAGVAALMADLIADLYKMILKQRSLFLSAMVPFVFLANFVFQISVSVLLISCCLCCITCVWLQKKKEGETEDE